MCNQIYRAAAEGKDPTFSGITNDFEITDIYKIGADKENRYLCIVYGEKSKITTQKVPKKSLNIKHGGKDDTLDILRYHLTRNPITISMNQRLGDFSQFTEVDEDDTWKNLDPKQKQSIAVACFKQKENVKLRHPFATRMFNLLMSKFDCNKGMMGTKCILGA
jgi:hypothetical protein